jgi:hypothetical protein
MITRLIAVSLVCTGLAALTPAAGASEPALPLSSGAIPVTKCPAPLVWDVLQARCELPDAIAPHGDSCTATLIFDPDDPSPYAPADHTAALQPERPAVRARGGTLAASLDTGEVKRANAARERDAALTTMQSD